MTFNNFINQLQPGEDKLMNTKKAYPETFSYKSIPLNTQIRGRKLITIIIITQITICITTTKRERSLEEFSFFVGMDHTV